MKSLTVNQKKSLRGLGHALKPAVMIGDAGLTEAVLQEFQQNLDHHELLKVKIRAGDRAGRDAIIERLCQAGQADVVQRIGNVALLFRANPERNKIKLPKS